MSNMSIELHDSDIEEIKVNNNEINIIFTSVIIHVSDGRPGIDAGDVYVQKAELLFQGNCGLVGKIKEYPVLISHGTLQINEFIWENEIPVPLNRNGKVRFSISQRDIGDEIIITSESVLLTLLDKPKYLETFPGKLN